MPTSDPIEDGEGIMRRLRFAVAAAVVLAAPIAKAGDITKLQQECVKALPDGKMRDAYEAGYCLGMVAAAGDITAYELQQRCVQALSDISQPRTTFDVGFCLGFIVTGAPITCYNTLIELNSVGLMVFLAWAKRFPQHLYIPARQAVDAAFNAAYHCDHPSTTPSAP
jgi:hypothetical protein